MKKRRRRECQQEEGQEKEEKEKEREGDLKVNGLLAGWLSHCCCSCQLHVDSLNVVVGHQPCPSPLLLLLLKGTKRRRRRTCGGWRDEWRKKARSPYLDDICLCTDCEPLL